MSVEPKQLVILRRLTEHLEGVCPANGDDFDLANSVVRGRLVIGAEQGLPCLTIVEAPPEDVGPVADQQKTVIKHAWMLRVQGWTTPDLSHPTDGLYALMATVQRRLALLAKPDHESYMLNRSVNGVSVLPGMVVPADPRDGRAEYFFIPLVLSVTLDMSNPFLTV